MSARPADITLAERRRRTMLRRAGTPTMHLNMTPMIDVVFLLLIYFVLVADFARPASLAGLDVAQRSDEAADPFALPEVPTVLTVTSEGPDPLAFSIESERTLFGAGTSFEDEVADAAELLGARHAIIVRPAPDARWEHAVVVYRTLRNAGFERVELGGEER